LPIPSSTRGNYGASSWGVSRKNLNTLNVLGDDSCLALWTLDNTIAEVSGNFSGTSSSNLTYTSDGKINAAGVFNSNANIVIPSPRNAYPFSVSAWVQHDTGFTFSSNQYRIVMNLNIAGQRISLGVIRNDPWPIGLALFYGGTNHWSGSVSSFSPNSTNYFHIVWSVVGSNNSNHRVYFNGNNVSLTNNGGGHGGTAAWGIGSNAAGGEFWNGKLDHIRFFNKAISEQEAQYIYNFDE
jgi:hypothetical protein